MDLRIKASKQLSSTIAKGNTMSRSLGLRIGLGAGLAVLTLALSPVASAQWSVGAGLGGSNTKFNTGDFSAGSPLLSESQDKTKTAFKLFGGYDFTKNWGIEAGYADFGKPEYKYTGTGALAGGAGQAEMKESAWFAEGKGTYPINDQFNIFGKLGLTYNKASLHATSNNAALNAAAGFPYTASKSRSQAVFGVGGEFNASKNIGIRLEYENFGNFGDANTTGRTKVDMWSFGIAYKF
jgi:OOP family OmpA-OmpF porin